MIFWFSFFFSRISFITIYFYSFYDNDDDESDTYMDFDGGNEGGAEGGAGVGIVV